MEPKKIAVSDTEKELRKLLQEAVIIIHCHSRNTNKDFLLRARAQLKRKSTTTAERAQ